MTLTDVVTHWAHVWRHLTAWGAPVPATFTIKPYKKGRLGLAHPHVCTAEIRVTGILGEDLSTALHELAHLAAPGYEHHGDRWRDVYIRAAAEALGCDVHSFDVDVGISALDAQVREAVDRWLVRSGQLTVLTAIGVVS